jgi:tetratricopeptide (TPR) repeat protein
MPEFYREIKYYDEKTGRLLSTIQWEKAHPDTIHTIQVYFYDSQGRVSLDYVAAFYPVFRNAPIQTLISLHNYNDGLHAFRQFDASGERIYESCNGRYFDENVDITLEDYELSPFARQKPAVMQSEAYTACFGDLPIEAGHYIHPLTMLRTASVTQPASQAGMFDAQHIESTLVSLNQRVQQRPDDANAWLLRGRANFVIHDFHQASNDLSKAIELDGALDEAWFWRGMSRGRQGLLDEAIADLGVYLKRHPDSSLAYTKRGVRRLWKGDFKNAEQDLRKAIQIKPDNAEANDDLGVILSRRKKYAQAIKHFTTTISADPSYQKGYHNLALVYQITGHHDEALQRINEAIALDPDNKNSLLLKSEILAAMGQTQAAAKVQEQAEFMSSGNWSERMQLK